jgi:aspartate aminotransferase
MMPRLRESSTIAFTRRARELKSAGRDVLVISGGEPDFPTPPHIRQAAVAAIEAGQTKYTSTEGTPALKAAIAEKFRRENGLNYQPGQVVVGTGAKQVIFNALMATIGPGDEAVIPTPSWVSYPDIVELAGGTPVFVPCRRDNGFKMTAADLARSITPRTRWLILNSPNNPSGAVLSEAELRGYADVLLGHPQVMILSDDIYEHIVFDDSRFATIAAVEPRLADRTLTVNGVSKAYCMTGFRIGYAAGPKWLIDAMIKLQGQETNGPCSISQAASVAALTGPHHFIAEHNAAYARRRDLVVSRLNAIDGISCDPPRGAFYVFADVSALIGRVDPAGKVMRSDTDIAVHLLEAGGVALIPGTGFGLSPYVRICFAYDDAVMADACDRIASAVAQLRVPA